MDRHEVFRPRSRRSNEAELFSGAYYFLNRCSLFANMPMMGLAAPLKLISTDFDGTLFAEFENPPIPADLQELIAALQAQGAKWVINTGRDMSSLMEALGRAGITIEPDYLVLVEREIYLHQESQYLGLEE